jgi:hypothetical protein
MTAAVQQGRPRASARARAGTLNMRDAASGVWPIALRGPNTRFHRTRPSQRNLLPLQPRQAYPTRGNAILYQEPQGSWATRSHCCARNNRVKEWEMYKTGDNGFLHFILRTQCRVVLPCPRAKSMR